MALIVIIRLSKLLMGLLDHTCTTFGRTQRFLNDLIALLSQQIAIELMLTRLEEFFVQNAKTDFSTMTTNVFKSVQRDLKITQWLMLWWEDWLKECFVSLVLFEDALVVWMTLVSNVLQILQKINFWLVESIVQRNVFQTNSLMVKDAQIAHTIVFPAQIKQIA